MDFIYKFLSEILIASGGLAVISKLFFTWLQKRRCKKFTDGIVNIGSMYDILQEARSHLKCQRILVLKSTNGGGIPKLDSEIYSSVLYEVYDSEVQPIKEDWQNKIVDFEYSQMLCNLVLLTRVKLNIKDLKGELKNIYDLYGHKHSCIVGLRSLPDKFLYVSFVFDREITNKDQAIIDLTTTKIKNELNKHLSGVSTSKV